MQTFLFHVNLCRWAVRCGKWAVAMRHFCRAFCL